ncbi:hypothetical protein CDAR_59041 [Caerostris darwini]|uniref:Ycf15 n=1 Tax=Caerostris darwini TaxID=1538125 RepID=A0AAV4X5X5_9ARAC|nr:hypothetical protein CDAR_59041 [Caerostris darwini]
MIFIMHQCTPNLIYSSEFCRFSRKHVIRSLRDKHSCERSGQRDWLSFGGGTRREISKNNFPLIRHKLSRTTHEMAFFRPKNGFSMLPIHHVFHLM